MSEFWDSNRQNDIKCSPENEERSRIFPTSLMKTISNQLKVVFPPPLDDDYIGRSRRSVGRKLVEGRRE